MELTKAQIEEARAGFCAAAAQAEGVGLPEVATFFHDLARRVGHPTLGAAADGGQLAESALLKSLRLAAIDEVQRARGCLAHRKGWYPAESDEMTSLLATLRDAVDVAVMTTGVEPSFVTARACSLDECRAQVALAHRAVTAWRCAGGRG